MSTFSPDLSPADSLSTRLIHAPQVDSTAFQSQAMPVYRASTVFFPDAAAQRAHVDPLGLDYSYGLHGTPTQYQLASQLARIENATHCLVVPSGLAAISVTALALLNSGDHWLIPDNVYLPTLQIAQAWKADFGIEFDVYDPNDPADFINKCKPSTVLAWIEAPGSITFEVPDIAALVAHCQSNEIYTAIDNTWSAGLTFKPFEWGIDLSIQALSKYQGGHADLLMGSVCSNNTKVFANIERYNRLLGLGVSPDDCSLVLRGLQTLPLRYDAQAHVALELAQWLASHPSVQRVLHPALPSGEGHVHWTRYFTGSASIFSILLTPDHSDDDSCSVVDRLRLFKIGYSWGGPESLALAMKIPPSRTARLGGGALIRLAVGLESFQDLRDDLAQALGT